MESRTVLNAAPVAVLSGATSINVGDSLTLDGGMSYDPDSGPSAMTYTWTLNGMSTPAELGYVHIFDWTNLSTAYGFTAGNTYAIALTVDDGQDTNSVSGSVTVNSGTANQAPTAIVTAPLTINVGETLSLMGGMSSDPDNAPSPLTFAWDLNGDSVTDDTTANPVISWATLASYGYGFGSSIPITLIVSDGAANSLPATATVPVAANQVPVAIVSAPPTMTFGETLSLMGGMSFDPDSAPSPLMYAWDLNGDSVTDDTTANPVISWGTLAGYGFGFGSSIPITLIVSDGAASSAPATMTVTVAANQVPVAIVSAPPTIIFGDTLNLFGGMSFDPDNAPSPLTYAWDINADSIVDSTDANPSFDWTALVGTFGYGAGGNFTISLTVSDGLATHTATAPVTVLVLSATGASDVDEGSLWQLTANASQPVDSWTVSWGDTEINPYPGGSSLLLVDHTYADDDPTNTPQDLCNVLVQATVAGQLLSLTVPVMVKNVPSFIRTANISSPAEGPSPAISAPPIPTGRKVRISGDIEDPSFTDLKEVRIKWNATTETQATLSGPTGYSGEHTYAAPGKYTVEIKVKDDDSADFSIRETTVVVDHRPVANADSHDIQVGSILKSDEIQDENGIIARDVAGNPQLRPVTADDILDNDTDADFVGSPPAPNNEAGRQQEPTLEQATQHGTLTLNGDGKFSYVPDRGYVGEDSFYYTVSDGLLSSRAQHTDPATKVTIVVHARAGNLPPVAVDDVGYQVVRNRRLVVDTPTPLLLANDSDGDVGDTVTVSRVTVQPANGTVSVAGDGKFTYTPKRNFVGLDSFKYRATDGIDESNEATVNIAVNAGSGNTPPTAAGDTYLDNDPIPAKDQELDSNEISVRAVDGVIANDTDADGDHLTARIVTPPPQNSYDKFSFNPDGSFRFERLDDYRQDVTFTYAVSDGIAESPPITVTLQFVNPPLIAVRDEYFLNVNWALPQTLNTTSAYVADTPSGEDQDDDVPELSILKNDNPDIPAAGVTLAIVTQPRFAQNFTANFNTANGSFRYEPIANWSHGSIRASMRSPENPRDSSEINSPTSWSEVPIHRSRWWSPFMGHGVFSSSTPRLCQVLPNLVSFYPAAGHPPMRLSVG